MATQPNRNRTVGTNFTRPTVQQPAAQQQPATTTINPTVQNSADTQQQLFQPSGYDYWADKLAPNRGPVSFDVGMTPFTQNNQDNTVQQTRQPNQIFDPSMGAQYNNVIRGMLTGSAYDPMEQANKEAQNRIEQQQRAKTVDQINRFGGVGQGVGNSIANATESNILQNRFTQNLENAKAREELKQQGLNAYENSINAENNLTNVDRNKLALNNDQVNFDRNKVALEQDKNALDQNRFVLQQTKLDTADKISGDFSSYIQNSTNLKNATIDQIAADQGAMSKGQAMWESMGGQGQVDPAWVKNMVDRVNDPVLNDTFVQSMNDAQSYLQQGLITQDEFNAISQVNRLALTGGIQVGENGELTLKEIGTVKTDETEKQETQGLTDAVLSGTFSAQQIMSDPDRLKIAKDNAVELNTGIALDRKGANARRFSAAPEKNVPFKYNGKTYVRGSDVKTKKLKPSEGYDYEYYTITDLDTGKNLTVSCKAGQFKIE